VRASRQAAAWRAPAAMLMLGLAGCATDAPPAAGTAGHDQDRLLRLVAHQAVLLRGWVGENSVGLEPVMATAAEARSDDLHGGDGAYRLRGYDDQGAVVFDIRFGDEALSQVADRPERQFMIVAPVGEGGTAVLAALLLEGGPGLVVERRASTSSVELREALEDRAALRIDVLDGARLRLRWDAERFELLQARDPASGEMLALARHGDIMIDSGGAAELEIALSDGVRSLAGVFRAH